MNVNKVEYSGETLIDLTSDTVTKDSLLSGATAHNSAGEKISGNVDLSEYLKNNGNASNTTVSFTEATNMAELVTDEDMSTLFGKLKLTVRNVISVLKLLGSTDISHIGGGTVTGAISTLNSNLEHIISDVYKYHVPASELGTTGWKTPNVNQEFTIPDGYVFAGIFSYAGTYRIAAIQPVLSTGTVSFTFYLLAALSTDIDIVWRAVFKKI